jgi:hypothetical protein
MQGEADDTIFRRPCFVVAMQELDVDILIERARQAISRTRKNAPTAAALGRVGDRGVLGGIAEAENGKRFQRTIEDDSTRRYSPTGHVSHAERICH